MNGFFIGHQYCHIARQNYIFYIHFAFISKDVFTLPIISNLANKTGK